MSNGKVISDQERMLNAGGILRPVSKIMSDAINKLSVRSNVLTRCPTGTTQNYAGKGGSNASALGVYETQRTNLNLEILAGNSNVLDLSSAISGSVVASGTASGQMEYAAANSDDGLHPNNMGHDVLAAYAYLRLTGRI